MRSDVNIFIKRDKCYVCGICIERCIMDNLRMYLAPCRQACPIHMNCQGYVRLIAQGKEEEAAKEMRKDLPFSGNRRAGLHPSVRGEVRKTERGQSAGSYPCPETIFGRQPAGHCFRARSFVKGNREESGDRRLRAGGADGGVRNSSQRTCGDGLRFRARAGGHARFGIPAFRLPGEETAKVVGMLERMKVVFQTGRALGKELDIEKLEREWDALLLATGGGPALRLGIPGEDLPGVFQGLDLLRQAREGRAPRIGRSVLVIGGGNTAVDAALTCRKLGAEQVSLICLEERSKMPAFPAEIEEALEEGVKIQDCWGPRRIVRNGNGALTVDLSRCLSVFDERGPVLP